jgi:hypothetical protein
MRSPNNWVEADVRCFATADAGAGKLEHWLQHRAGQGGALGVLPVEVGQVRKKSQLLWRRAAGLRRHVEALREMFDLSRIGQASTHSVQPVQSSGAT